MSDTIWLIDKMFQLYKFCSPNKTTLDILKFYYTSISGGRFSSECQKGRFVIFCLLYRLQYFVNFFYYKIIESTKHWYRWCLQSKWNYYEKRFLLLVFRCKRSWLNKQKGIQCFGVYFMLGSHCRVICYERHDWPFVADRRKLLNRPKFYYDQHDCHDWQSATDC